MLPGYTLAPRRVYLSASTSYLKDAAKIGCDLVSKLTTRSRGFIVTSWSYSLDEPSATIDSNSYPHRRSLVPLAKAAGASINRRATTAYGNDGNPQEYRQKDSKVNNEESIATLQPTYAWDQQQGSPSGISAAQMVRRGPGLRDIAGDALVPTSRQEYRQEGRKVNHQESIATLPPPHSRKQQQGSPSGISAAQTVRRGPGPRNIADHAIVPTRRHRFPPLPWLTGYMDENTGDGASAVDAEICEKEVRQRKSNTTGGRRSNKHMLGSNADTDASKDIAATKVATTINDTNKNATSGGSSAHTRIIANEVARAQPGRAGGSGIGSSTADATGVDGASALRPWFPPLPGREKQARKQPTQTNQQKRYRIISPRRVESCLGGESQFSRKATARSGSDSTGGGVHRLTDQHGASSVERSGERRMKRGIPAGSVFSHENLCGRSRAGACAGGAGVVPPAGTGSNVDAAYLRGGSSGGGSSDRTLKKRALDSVVLPDD